MVRLACDAGGRGSRGSVRLSTWRGRAARFCAVLIAINVAVWAWAWTSFGGDGMLLGTAVLAYAFGLRHAVDADHIAAIDNAARKLIEAGRPAAATGFFFSLGHATVVVLASLAVGLGSSRLPTSFGAIKPFAGAVGAGVSAVSLFALAVANAAILVSVCRLLAAQRRGDRPIEAELDRLVAGRGLLVRVLRGVFRLISKSWQMYPLGFLFGLGFDTATEIGLLGVSAAQASHGLPLRAIMVFPALFAAGMVLVDTLDALLMTGAYRWALSQPLRKLRYNLAITSISVVVAVAIGGVELLGLFDGAAGLPSGLSPIVANLNEHLAAIGSAIIACCAAAWLLSVLLWRFRSVSSG
jgi:nickel/cobalt transporter (NiCoT) family protein